MGLATRVTLALISLLFLSGAIVLLFLLLLAGSRDVNSLNPIFFLQADTSGIPGAPDGICHWTLYNFCSSTPDGLNTACRPNTAAYPLDPVRNFGTTQGVPQDFVNHSRKYFYLSRFLFAFYIIDLFFSLSALLLGFWAVVGRYGGYLAAALVGTAWFCSAFNATVMTAVYTMGQNAWRREGRFARVGVKAMGFTWTIFVLTGLAVVGFVAAAMGGRRGGQRGFSRLGEVRREMGEKEEERRLRAEGTTT